MTATQKWRRFTSLGTRRLPEFSRPTRHSHSRRVSLAAYSEAYPTTPAGARVDFGNDATDAKRPTIKSTTFSVRNTFLMYVDGK